MLKTSPVGKVIWAKMNNNELTEDPASGTVVERDTLVRYGLTNQGRITRYSLAPNRVVEDMAILDVKQQEFIKSAPLAADERMCVKPRLTLELLAPGITLERRGISDAAKLAYARDAAFEDKNRPFPAW